MKNLTPIPGSDSRPMISASLVIFPTDEALSAGESPDLSFCTSSLGLEPTKLQTAGEPGRWGQPVRVSEWRFSLDRCRADDIDDVVANLLHLIWPRRSELSSLLQSGDLRATVYIGVHIEEDRPVYGLSRDSLHRLAELGVDWALDIFDYREDE